MPRLMTTFQSRSPFVNEGANNLTNVVLLYWNMPRQIKLRKYRRVPLYDHKRDRMDAASHGSRLRIGCRCFGDYTRHSSQCTDSANCLEASNCKNKPSGSSFAESTQRHKSRVIERLFDIMMLLEPDQRLTSILRKRDWQISQVRLHLHYPTPLTTSQRGKLRHLESAPMDRCDQRALAIQ